MTNQPELKACPMPQCLSNDVHLNHHGCFIECRKCNFCMEWQWQNQQPEVIQIWNARPSPIIPEDAYPKPIDEKTVPEEFDNIIADDALREAIESCRTAFDLGKPYKASNVFMGMTSQHAETLVTRAIKGQSK